MLTTATVPPKAKGRKRNREADKPLSGLDVDELLRGEKRLKISPDNAIPEFKQALASSTDLNAMKEAIEQMRNIVENEIRHSLGDAKYDHIVECLNTMKEELIGYEEPGLYNVFVKELKTKILGEELGGDRRELWWLIRRHKMGLIDKEHSEFSDVTEEQAKEVNNHSHSRFIRFASNKPHSSCILNDSARWAWHPIGLNWRIGVLSRLCHFCFNVSVNKKKFPGSEWGFTFTNICAKILSNVSLNEGFIQGA